MTTPPIPVTPPPVPPPLIPAVKPITLTVNAHEVIDATLAQLETTGSTLLSEAIKEAITLLEPVLMAAVTQLEQALPGLLAQALKHLFVKAPEMEENS
jgi:hypothetical protein